MIFVLGGIEMWFAELMGRIVLLILGVAVVFFSSQLTYYTEFGPGPGFLPIWLGMGLTGSAIFLILDFLRKQVKAEAFLKPRTKQCALMFILIVVAFLLLPWLGFSIGFALLAGTAMRVMGRHSWRMCGITAVAIAIGIYFMFDQWLGIPLPTGIVGW
jgi:putative tricarboxylic transport membrane protein